MILDNYTTHKTCSAGCSRIHGFTAFHPDWSLLLNLAERWFAELTVKKLRRSAHKSVAHLNADIRAWIDTWNENLRPFAWTKTAEQILESLSRYCQRINDSGH